MANIGFSGTRFGMTDRQKETLLVVMRELISDKEQTHSLHAGDCVGADDEAVNIGAGMKREGYQIVLVCHPPFDEAHRVFSKLYDEYRLPRTHFARNRQIVEETDVLVVCPLQAERQDRGGTWYTYDFAIKRGKRVIMIKPDGERVETGSRGE